MVLFYWWWCVGFLGVVLMFIGLGGVVKLLVYVVCLCGVVVVK